MTQNQYKSDVIQTNQLHNVNNIKATFTIIFIYYHTSNIY